MNNERERDDAALIAEIIETLRHVKNGLTATNIPAHNKIDALLAKLQPPAEPDRAEVLWEEAHSAFYYKAEEGYAHACDVPREDRMALVREVINRHFAELRAEIEAERPVIDVTLAVREATETGLSYKPGHTSHTLARFVKQLIDGAGVRAKPVFSEEVLAAAERTLKRYGFTNCD